MTNFILANIGIILNLLGTFLVAFSFGPFLGQKDHAYTEKDNGDKIHIAFFNHPKLFWVGIILLSAGFVFQLKLKDIFS